MKKIIIILCIILTPFTLLCYGQQQPPEIRPLEVQKEVFKELQQPPEIRPPEVPKKPSNPVPTQQPPEIRPPEVTKKPSNPVPTQQPPEIRPPEVTKEQPPGLVPKCKDIEIFRDGKCVKK